MAKIKKRRLRWTASDSPQVVGYKLYWASGGERVSYESPCEKLGNVTEIVLPDDVTSFSLQNGPIEFGITAIDELGNESDLIALGAPYQFNAPKAPDKFWIEGAEKSPSAADVPKFKAVSPSPASSHREPKVDEAPKTEGIRATARGTGSSQNWHPVPVAMRRPENAS